VRKAASLTDGRGVVLTLTPEGHTAWQRAMDVIAQRNKDIFGVLGAEAQTQLSSFFDRLIDQAQAGGELAEDSGD
jgi:DNA-binding MarR family transcriptional regulator